MSPLPSTIHTAKTERISHEGSTRGSKVVLYNCSCHTFESVITQLMYAVGCSYEAGNRYAHIIHLNGKATVYTGTQEKCDDVADRLAEIGLIVRLS